MKNNIIYASIAAVLAACAGFAAGFHYRMKYEMDAIEKELETGRISFSDSTHCEGQENCDGNCDNCK